MKKLLFLLILIVSITINLEADYLQLPDRHIHILAADSLEGRYPGSKGCDKAANYIREQFKNYNLELLADSAYQYFDIIASVTPDTIKTELASKDLTYVLGKEYRPMSFSNDYKVQTEPQNISFVGYGFDIDEDSLKWNDYTDIDVENRWVIILRGDPEMEKASSPFVRYSNDMKKVLVAQDKGVAGVILVSTVAYSEKDDLETKDNEKIICGLPVIQVTRELAVSLIKNNKTIEKIENELNQSHRPNSFHIENKIDVNITMKRNKIKTKNVIGLQKAKDSEEYIVVGGHFDHLGYGGSHTGSLIPDTNAIHNGADDNASGIAAVLEIARLLKDKQLDKNIIFVAFGAEEMGLIGSKYFVSNPIIDLDKIALMLNFDMVGSLDVGDNILTIGGVGTWKESADFLEKYASNNQIKAEFKQEGFGPSDHASFYSNNIPVLYFFTGTHDRYHKPIDDTKYINFAGLKKISKLGSEIVEKASSRDTKISFVEVISPNSNTRRTRMIVTLGIVPDHGAEVKGLGVAGVRPNRPASIGGMLKGDVITAINGKPINNIYDYMHRLGSFEKGKRINIEVQRDGKAIILIIDL